jgi:hypothetical protein
MNVLSGGLNLPDPGGYGTELQSYQVLTGTLTFNSAVSSNVTVRYELTKIGCIVSLQLAAFSVAPIGTIVSTSDGVIPVPFRFDGPVGSYNTTDSPLQGINGYASNGSTLVASAITTTSGALRLYIPAGDVNNGSSTFAQVFMQWLVTSN